jgi:hypothetical protein
VIIKRGITHRINQGNYEHVEIRAEVETDLDHHATREEVIELQCALDDLVAPDLKRARKVFPDDLEFTSYITEWGEK